MRVPLSTSGSRIPLGTIGLFLGFALAATAGSAHAAPIPLGGGGLLSISNTLGQSATLNLSCFAFGADPTCTATASVSTPPGSDPLFQVGPTTGTIKDLSLSSTSVTDLLTEGSALGPIDFDMTGFVATGLPTCTAASTTACVLPGTQVELSPGGTPNQVNVSFQILANAYAGGSTATGFTPYQGLFSTQLSGFLSNGAPVSIANIVIFLSGSPANSIGTTWSATLAPVTAPVPEPASMVLFAGGLGAAMLRRRRRRA